MTKICRLCGKSQAFHFCRDVAPGATLSCKALRLKETQEQKKTRERQLAANLNKGVELGSSNKELANRLSYLTLRSYSEVGKIMCLSPQAVRLIELRAINKLRKLLMPYKNSLSGTDKVRQITAPIASLED